MDRKVSADNTDNDEELDFGKESPKTIFKKTLERVILENRSKKEQENAKSIEETIPQSDDANEKQQNIDKCKLDEDSDAIHEPLTRSDPKRKRSQETTDSRISTGGWKRKSKPGPKGHEDSLTSEENVDTGLETGRKLSRDVCIETQTEEEDNSRSEENKKVNIKYKGRLELKKGRLGSWKSYYCVLNGHQLVCYKSEKDYMNLESCKRFFYVSEIAEVNIKRPGFLHSHFPFSIKRHNSSIIKFAAPSSQQREEWISYLNKTADGDSLKQHSSQIVRTSSLRQSSSSYENQGPLRQKSATLPSVRDLDSANVKNDNEVEGLIKPHKPEMQKGYILKASEIASVHLKKTKQETAKESSESPPPSPKTPPKKPMRSFKSTSQDKSPIIEESPNQTLAMVDAPKKRRSPSPNIPISPSVQSVIEKSEQETRVFESTKIVVGSKIVSSKNALKLQDKCENTNVSVIESNSAQTTKQDQTPSAVVICTNDNKDNFSKDSSETNNLSETIKEIEFLEEYLSNEWQSLKDIKEKSPTLHEDQLPSKNSTNNAKDNKIINSEIVEDNPLKEVNGNKNEEAIKEKHHTINESDQCKVQLDQELLEKSPTSSSHDSHSKSISEESVNGNCESIKTSESIKSKKNKLSSLFRKISFGQKDKQKTQMTSESIKQCKETLKDEQSDGTKLHCEKEEIPKDEAATPPNSPVLLRKPLFQQFNEDYDEAEEGNVFGDDEHPPKLPEKKRIREPSGYYDVPKKTPVDKDTFSLLVSRKLSEHIEEEEESSSSSSSCQSTTNNEPSQHTDKIEQHVSLTLKVDDAKDADLKRPLYLSYASTESDVALPETTFLGSDRSSCTSSEIIPNQKEMTNETFGTEFNGIKVDEQDSRTNIQEDIINDIKITPEILVIETGKEEYQSHKSSPEAEEEADSFLSYDLVKTREINYIRNPATAEMRTSGIIQLKDLLQETELSNEGKPAVSRLGHSVAIEKLKNELN